MMIHVNDSRAGSIDLSLRFEIIFSLWQLETAYVGSTDCISFC